MSTEQFDIFFSGQMIEGEAEDEVRTKVGRIFKANSKQLERLFSGQAVKIKSGVDLDSAVKYRIAFRNAGALVDIKPAATDSTSPPTQPQTTNQSSVEPAPPEKDGIELLPPNTGSLIDYAAEVTPATIANIDNLDFGSQTDPLDEREPPPPANIDTQGLTLNSAHSETMLDETAPPPAANINTDSLVLNPVNTGSLEDCQQAAEPVEIPDISALEVIEPKS